MKRCLKLMSPFVISIALLTACNSSSDVKEDEKQHRVDNLSNKINTKYKKKNGVVEKDGKVHEEGVVDNKESREMNNR